MGTSGSEVLALYNCSSRINLDDHSFEIMIVNIRRSSDYLNSELNISIISNVLIPLSIS